MSEDDKVTDFLCCAACGIAEIDEIKLSTVCDDCDLVRYCSDECQLEHSSEHKEECKQRAAELRDELLFKQPESTHLGDCPICSLPMSIVVSKSTMYDCCGKLICNGCEYANKIREIELRLQQSCPFCRKPSPKTESEQDKRRMKRIEKNDPVAICQEGMIQYKKGEYIKAFEYYTKAAALGNVEAHYRLSILYHLGHGVEKDEEKEIFHLEEAAIVGHPFARYVLGWHEYNNGNPDRAVKHFIIAAAQGEDGSIKTLMEAFKEGIVEKDDLASALRAHQAAVDTMKSPQRMAAEESCKFR